MGFDQMVVMGNLLEFTPTFPLFRAYVVDLVSPHYDQLGWRDDGSHVERMNRYNILGLACKYGHTGCRQEAGRLFQRWVDTPGDYIAPNLRSLVYKYGAVRGRCVHLGPDAGAVPHRDKRTRKEKIVVRA